MKTAVKLAVLIATLLLLTDAAFAGGMDCNCYEVTFTNLDNPEDSGTGFTELCFNYGNPTGTFENLCGENGNLILFFDHHPMQALAYYVDTTPVPVVGYLKFHEWLTLFNGILTCPDASRYIIRGHPTDPDHCNFA